LDAVGLVLSTDKDGSFTIDVSLQHKFKSVQQFVLGLFPGDTTGPAWVWYGFSSQNVVRWKKLAYSIPANGSIRFFEPGAGQIATAGVASFPDAAGYEAVSFAPKVSGVPGLTVTRNSQPTIPSGIEQLFFCKSAGSLLRVG
jgi:hypothetical protein